MATLTIELRPQKEQTSFNLRRWEELLADPELAKVEGRFETDRYGRIIMYPPPAPPHGSFQSWIAHLLTELIRKGRVYSECPISTADGVKAADVAWASAERVRELGNSSCFPRAPEVCVEVLSPSNTADEIAEKMDLYFDAGAEEVWICSESGEMKFIEREAGRQLAGPKVCPRFPIKVELPPL
jgi:Uma2 family endonuclease